jgi:ATP-dependent DNA helicase HFM1/MER3
VFDNSYANTAPDAVNSLVRFIAVSATLPNISEVATFFDANEAYTFDESYRPVPLTTHVIGQGKAKGNSSSEFHFWKNLDRNVPEIIVRFSNQRAAIVFCHSKLDCEKLADLLATTHNIGRRDNATSSLAPQTRVSKLQRVLLYGIGYHHAGLELDDRRLVEKAFLNGTIRVLCATSTLALGVNLPAHLVVIKGTKAWRGGAGYQDLDQATLLQMIGRAGRPGFDSTGTAVIMTDNDSKHKFETLASSGLPSARSQCKEDKLIVMMNTEISQQVITSIRDSLNWIRSTLFYVQLTHKPEAHGKRVESNHATDDFIMQLCTSAIQKLQSIGAVIVGGKGKITPLAASHVMSQHLVDFQVMKQIFLLPHDTSQAQILKTLAHIESLQRPVRRSEKKTLNAAHKTLKKYKLEGPASKVRVKEPWEKSFVLLQAHIEDIPIDDYAMRQEMNSMVDYATRMLSAIEEHAIQGSRNGNIIVQCLLIRRAFAVHLWAANDGSLLKQIQGISGSLAFQLQMNGIFNFEDVMKNPIDKIEKAANRQSPFGAELKQACEQIIASRLKISTASIINIEDEGPGHAIECRIDRVCPIQDSGEYESNESNSNPTVIYTLVAYTDQPGGCILFESKISSPATYNAPLPSYFRKITVRLIASIVGLDGTFKYNFLKIPF